MYLQAKQKRVAPLSSADDTMFVNPGAATGEVGGGEEIEQM